MIAGTKVKEKRKHYTVPEDFTNFDEHEYRRFTFTEVFLGIIAIGLLILCVIQAIQFK